MPVAQQLDIILGEVDCVAQDQIAVNQTEVVQMAYQGFAVVAQAKGLLNWSLQAVIRSRYIQRADALRA